MTFDITVRRNTYCNPLTHPPLLFAGWSDASTGPLLLRIQTHYDVSYPIVSLIFVCAFIGFALAAGINVWVETRWGFGKAVGFAAGCQVGRYSHSGA